MFERQSFNEESNIVVKADVHAVAKDFAPATNSTEATRKIYYRMPLPGCILRSISLPILHTPTPPALDIPRCMWCGKYFRYHIDCKGG